MLSHRSLPRPGAGCSVTLDPGPATYPGCAAFARILSTSSRRGYHINSPSPTPAQRETPRFLPARKSLAVFIQNEYRTLIFTAHSDNLRTGQEQGITSQVDVCNKG